MSYTIIYMSQTLWLRSITEELEYCVIRLIILKIKFNLVREWKMKMIFFLKVKSACPMLAHLCTPLWRYLTLVYGILIVDVLAIWQEINHCLSLSKRRLVTMWHLGMEAMLKFLAKGLLKYQGYLYWRMFSISKGLRRIS